MKKYIEAELEVIAFDAEDIITTSCNPDNSCPLDYCSTDGDCWE